MTKAEARVILAAVRWYKPTQQRGWLYTADQEDALHRAVTALLAERKRRKK